MSTYGWYLLLKPLYSKHLGVFKYCNCLQSIIRRQNEIHFKLFIKDPKDKAQT